MSDFRSYAVYELSGKIDRIVRCHTSLSSLQANAGEYCVECADTSDDVTHYVFSGQVIERQPLNLPASLQITADGIDEAVVTGIPAGVTVEWPDGQIDEVTDGEVRFSVDLPGTYTLTFDAIPYLRQEVTIEAVAAT